MSKVSTDPIADMLTRIRNAIAVNKSELTLPYSSIKEAIAKILVSTNYLNGVSVLNEGTDKLLNIVIASEGLNAKITEIERISKPGRRTYVSAKEIPLVKQGRGMVIVSTSKGIMSGTEARQHKLGGELICKVY